MNIFTAKKQQDFFARAYVSPVKTYYLYYIRAPPKQAPRICRPSTSGLFLATTGLF
jgi:hypothetical protein